MEVGEHNSNFTMVFDTQVTIVFMFFLLTNVHRTGGTILWGLHQLSLQNRGPKSHWTQSKKKELPSNAENLVVKNGKLIVEI